MKRTLGLVVLVLTFCGQSLADQITLKNGDRVTGKIVKSDGSKLVVKTDLLGAVTVELASVANIAGDQQLFVTLADGRTVSGVLNADASKAELRAGNATAVAIDRSAIAVIRSSEEQIAYERSLNPGWLEGWSGGANIGLALTSGNSDTTNFAVGLAMNRETRRDNTSVYLASVYSRDSITGDSRTTANTIRGGWRYERDIKGKLFAFIFNHLEHNGLQDLNLRFVLGGGLGYHAIHNERTQLDLMGGLNWNREYFKEDFPDRSSAEVNLGQTLSHRFNSRLTVKEQLLIFPNLTDGGQYRVNFETALITDITRRIGWQLTLSNRYLSNPPPGFGTNDLLLTTGLKIKLGEVK